MSRSEGNWLLRSAISVWISIEDWSAPTTLEPDAVRQFENEFKASPSATHVRLNIYPDGGVSRLRVFGKIN